MNVPSQWWTEFFSGLALEVTGKLFPPDRTRAEADFIADKLGVSSGSAVLDVPCGDGRLSLCLAQRGCRVTGVDQAPALIEAAGQAAAARNLTATFQVRDMRDLPWSDAFDGIFCFGNSFGYMDDDANAAFLAAVARVLRSGGRFLLDYPVVAEALLSHLQERTWYPIGDVTMLIERRYDPARGRLDVEYTFIRAGVAERRPASYRIYTYREICALLRHAGFMEPVGYGSIGGEPFALGARGLYLLAARK